MSKQVLTDEQTRKTALMSFVVAWLSFILAMLLLSIPSSVDENGNNWGGLFAFVLPAYLMFVGIPSVLLLILSRRKDKQGELFALFSTVAHTVLTILLIGLVVWWNI